MQLRNGDRLTCEIKKLEQGRLSVSTDPLDTVSVHWLEVAAITSPRVFEITVGAGNRYYGSLGPSTQTDELVVAELGGSSSTLKLWEVTALVPIGVSFWNRIDGNVDVGFSFAQANLETHWTINGGASYRSTKYFLTSSLASQLTLRQDADRISRNTFSLTGNRLFDNPWFLTVLGQIQQNEELQLDLRTVGGGGAGRILSQSSTRNITTFAGLVYTREQFVDQPVANSAEIALGGQVNFFSSLNNDVSLTNTVVSYYDVTGRGRVRVELQSAWRQEFLKDFYWSLNGLESFDSAPPNGETKKNDASISLAIGWKF